MPGHDSGPDTVTLKAILADAMAREDEAEKAAHAIGREEAETTDELAALRMRRALRRSPKHGRDAGIIPFTALWLRRTKGPLTAVKPAAAAAAVSTAAAVTTIGLAVMLTVQPAPRAVAHVERGTPAAGVTQLPGSVHDGTPRGSSHGRGHASAGKQAAGRGFRASSPGRRSSSGPPPGLRLPGGHVRSPAPGLGRHLVHPATGLAHELVPPVTKIVRQVVPGLPLPAVTKIVRRVLPGLPGHLLPGVTKLVRQLLPGVPLPSVTRIVHHLVPGVTRIVRHLVPPLPVPSASVPAPAPSTPLPLPSPSLPVPTPSL